MSFFTKFDIIVIDFDETLIKQNSTNLVLSGRYINFIYRISRRFFYLLGLKGNFIDRIFVYLFMNPNKKYKLDYNKTVMKLVFLDNSVIVTHASSYALNKLDIPEPILSKIKYCKTSFLRKSKKDFAKEKSLIITDDLPSDSQGYDVAIHPKFLDKFSL